MPLVCLQGFDDPGPVDRCPEVVRPLREVSLIQVIRRPEPTTTGASSRFMISGSSFTLSVTQSVPQGTPASANMPQARLTSGSVRRGD